MGDVVEVKFGDRVPADIRILVAHGFKVNSRRPFARVIFHARIVRNPYEPLVGHRRPRQNEVGHLQEFNIFSVNMHLNELPRSCLAHVRLNGSMSNNRAVIFYDVFMALNNFCLRERTMHGKVPQNLEIMSY